MKFIGFLNKENQTAFNVSGYKSVVKDNPFCLMSASEDFKNNFSHCTKNNIHITHFELCRECTVPSLNIQTISKTTLVLLFCVWG